jgi:small-conductance mechanosensitive channel
LNAFIRRLLAVIVLFAGFAAAGQAAPDASRNRQPVVVYGDRLFFVTASSEEAAVRRADTIADRIEAAAADESIAVDDITSTIDGSSAKISAGPRTIFILSGADAAGIDRTLPEAADSVVRVIRAAVAGHRQERTPRAMAMHAAISLGAFLGLVAATIAAWRLMGRLVQVFYAKSVRSRPVDVVAGVELPLKPLVEVAVSLVRLVRLIVIGGMAYFCISFILRQFPSTRSLSGALVGPFFSALAAFVTGFVAWLPQLAIIILIAFVGYEASTFLRVVRDEMTAGRFNVHGFESDWIEPTYRLLSFGVLVFAVMAILPHLPGFDSPSFKAVGLVLSALVTFGSATTISNVLAGVVLIYAPSFRVGDFVKIGDAEGEVISKQLFVTQIRTLKNVVITIPNLSVAGATVFNFSSMPLRGSLPLIVHSTVTLGYDVPWRNIHEALIAAAAKTVNIVAEPAPFVLQTALNDFNVAYQINAYTRLPLLIPRISSELHGNIQDECNARGIEILSPGYQAIRDGNHSTIPEDQLPVGYTAPGFRVDLNGDAR